VGRMYVDQVLVDLISQLQQQIGVAPFGSEITNRFFKAFTKGKTVQQAMLDLVNDLFGDYGLVVLIADEPRLKKLYIPVLEADLFLHEPSRIVEATCNRLAEHHSVQQYPRDINVFYLKDAIRQRIEKTEEGYKVHDQDLTFTETELKELLHTHPEQFSPNVILRGLYQETILPNIAFIGGGGELAYWLQLKDLFDHFQVPYPVLVLRNSFLVVEEKWKDKIEKLGFTLADFFQEPDQLLNRIVDRTSANKVRLNGNFEKAENLYDQISLQAGEIDATLRQHVAALKTRSLKYLEELEKKMLRAEKRKYEAQNRQLRQIKSNLFPNENLQERVENMSYFYAQWGTDWLHAIYEHSLSLEQQFVILTHQKN
ncbi:MAG TPA: bacillithiol biosynthesis cysteine-adding enzyme BshC, partial [Flavisolibacter sp.]|nr:bacillithiol biosynthesis cysteine-adding enzyme BshC [Flavisolibacter sp.]